MNKNIGFIGSGNMAGGRALHQHGEVAAEADEHGIVEAVGDAVGLQRLE